MHRRLFLISRTPVALAAASLAASRRSVGTNNAADDDDGDVSWDMGDAEPTQQPPPPPPQPAVAAAAAPSAPIADTLPGAPKVVARRRTVTAASAGGGDATEPSATPPRSTVDDDDVDPEWQRASPVELRQRVIGYLSTCRAPTFVSESTERQMMPMLIKRQRELPLHDLLDVIEERWPAPTAERHFAAVSDCVRARILEDVAAFDLFQATAAAAGRGWQKDEDPELAKAESETPPPMSALLLARCIVVMGLRGRRRRDLDLFKALGKSLATCINDIRDPHTLCYVLLAFQSSRIRPPDGFLALVGRRLPVLNKKFPMAPLPAYRALCFYDRSAYELMNPYRFLADRVMAHIKSELQREGGGGAFIEPRIVTPVGGVPRPSVRGGDDDDLDESDFAILRQMRHEDTQPAAAAAAAAASPQVEPKPTVLPTSAAAEEGDAKKATAAPTTAHKDPPAPREAEEAVLDRAMPAYAVDPLSMSPNATLEQQTIDAATEGSGATHPEHAKRLERMKIRQRFFRLTQLKPPQLTKLLLILGRKQAPRQQYLRPIATDVLVPCAPHFNPPSFSRLIASMRAFQSEEAPLINLVIDVMCERGPEHVVLGDVLDMLFLLSRPNVPLPSGTDKFFDLCRRTFEDGSRLRPGDMRNIASDLKLIWKLKFEDAHANTPAFKNLVAVLDGFARRMATFLELGLLEPSSADVFLEICKELGQPGAEPSDAAARLIEAKRAAFADGEEQYHELVPVNVREVFMALQFVNSQMTHRGFRPLGAAAMQQFKAMLDYMRADDLLEAVHLYDQAYPRALSVPVRRVVGAFIVDKLALEVEVLTAKRAPPPPPPAPQVVPLRQLDESSTVDGHRRVYVPYDVTSPKYSPLLFKPATLAKFANMVLATPLQRVQRSRATWEFLSLKARQFQSDELKGVVEERLAILQQEDEHAALEEMRNGMAALEGRVHVASFAARAYV
jgi:hypothetical protein